MERVSDQFGSSEVGVVYGHGASEVDGTDLASLPVDGLSDSERKIPREACIAVTVTAC